MADEADEPRDWAWYRTEDGQTVERNWANIEKGLIPWDEVTDEELSKARMRAADGSWRYSINQKTPRKLIPELTRRLKERYDDKLREKLLEIQQVHLEVALDPTTPAGDRLRAARYVEERMIGKIPDKVEMIAEVKPWEGLVDGVLNDVTDE